MNDKSVRYWFPAKRYGWGWGLPSAWQGWVVLVAYLAVVAGMAYVFPPAHHAPAFYAGLVITTVVLLLVCLLKGEPPRWRTGGG